MNVVFNEGDPITSRVPNEPTAKMIQILINKGIVKDKKTAQLLLLSFAVIALMVSFYLFFNNIRTTDKVEYNLSPETINSLPQEIREKIYESKK